LVGSWYLKPPFSELSSYALNHTHQVLKIFVLVNKKSFGQNICNHILYISMHQLNKTSSIFFYTKWWWISICIIGTKKSKQQDFKNTWMKACLILNAGYKIRKSKTKTQCVGCEWKETLLQKHEKNMTKICTQNCCWTTESNVGF
jgi:hypothetical protein